MGKDQRKIGIIVIFKKQIETEGILHKQRPETSLFFSSPVSPYHYPLGIVMNEKPITNTKVQNIVQ